MATIIKNHKETEISGKVFFVDKYWIKGASVCLWRYGYYTADGTAILLKDGLFSRPNLKRLCL